MDDLLQKLRMGDVHRASKGRARQAHAGRLQRQSLSGAGTPAMVSPMHAPASAGADLNRSGSINDPGDQARGLLAQITGKDEVGHGSYFVFQCRCPDFSSAQQSHLSPTSPQFRVKRERRALKPLFPSNAADLLSQSQKDTSRGEELSARSPEAVIAEAEEAEQHEDDHEHESASVSGSDYSREDDDDSDIDDGRSNFAADDSIPVKQRDGLLSAGEQNDDDDEGDVTMRLRELSKTPSREMSQQQTEVPGASLSNMASSPSQHKRQKQEDDEYLSELSEDEAFAASLA